MCIVDWHRDAKRKRVHRIEKVHPSGCGLFTFGLQSAQVKAVSLPPVEERPLHGHTLPAGTISYGRVPGSLPITTNARARLALRVSFGSLGFHHPACRLGTGFEGSGARDDEILDSECDPVHITRPNPAICWNRLAEMSVLHIVPQSNAIGRYSARLRRVRILEPIEWGHLL